MPRLAAKSASSAARIRAHALRKRKAMRKVLFVITLPLWVGYLGFGIIYYIRKKEDMHFAALGDILAWFWE